MRSVYHKRTANKEKRMESYFLKKYLKIFHTKYNILSIKKKESKSIAADISVGKLLANIDRKNGFSFANCILNTIQ